MKRYDSYKDSGIEWIGEIPSDWDVTKHKYNLSVLSGFPFKSELFDNNQGFPLIRIRDITTGKIETFYKGEVLSDYIVTRGDLLIGMDGDYNIRWWENEDGLLNQRCCSIIESDCVSRRFLYYIFPMELKIINDLTYFTTVKHLSVNDIYNSNTILPPLSEQQQIVTFLDSKTSQIDELIQKKGRKIELLKEYRTSLINQVVTKGLNPNVEMKDSGVEWIGEIPSHWENPPLRYYFSYTKGSNGQKLTKSFIDDNRGEYPVYSGQTDNDGIMGFVNEFEFDYQFPLIFTTTVGAKYMTTRILQGKFSLSQNCLVMVKKKECIPSFIEYFLKIDFQYRKELIPIIIQPSLRMEDLDRVNIIVPPVTEQQQIVEYLDEQTQKIDSSIQIEERKIELLKEYRQSLISSVVTGKIDVRTN